MPIRKNPFWLLVGEVLDVGDLRGVPYEQRLDILTDHKIALWDVIDTCQRKGSLDAHISEAEVNDLSGFLREHGSVQAIFCNGRKSVDLFGRYALPSLGDRAEEYAIHYLPSSSPAHAAMTRVDKARHWRVLRDWLD